MIIVYGSRLYGRALVVPGVFHVATEFAHIYYIPLIPIRSWIVFSQQGRRWEGKPIGWSLRSILCAWGRAACLTAAIAMTCLAVNDGPRPVTRTHAPVPQTKVQAVLSVRRAGDPAAAPTRAPLQPPAQVTWLNDTRPGSVINIATIAPLVAGCFPIPTYPGIRRASRAPAASLCRRAALPEALTARVDAAVQWSGRPPALETSNGAPASPDLGRPRGF